MLSRLFAWVGGSDNGADGLLVEAFEATPPLEGFQVAAERAFGKKALQLFFGNQPLAPQFFSAFAAHRPAFALGEGLFEKLEIRERLHPGDVERFQLLADQRKIKSRLKVMHSGLEKTFAVQSHPQPDCSQPRWLRQ